MKVVVVGATGLVGSTMLQILAERNFPVTTLIPVANRSAGTEITFKGKKIKVVTPEEALAQKPDVALFSAGGAASLQWAPQFAAIGTRVIDNSSAWRMDPTKKLVVPEVNGHLLTTDDFIIANPNCSTIQLVMALYPLQQHYGVKRVVVSTYQSVTGTGQKAVAQLLKERAGEKELNVYPHPIDLNLLPHIDTFTENGYTKEEMKMVLETCKILGDDAIQISPTCVRVPVMGGHSESANIELAKDFKDEAELRTVLSAMPGLQVQDNPAGNEYPMPLFAGGRDEVFVGRIRRDPSQPRTFNCWIVADNLRKGAATNAIQIAEYLQKAEILPQAVI